MAPLTFGHRARVILSIVVVSIPGALGSSSPIFVLNPPLLRSLALQKFQRLGSGCTRHKHRRAEATNLILNCPPDANSSSPLPCRPGNPQRQAIISSPGLAFVVGFVPASLADPAAEAGASYSSEERSR